MTGTIFFDRGRGHFYFPGPGPSRPRLRGRGGGGGGEVGPGLGPGLKCNFLKISPEKVKFWYRVPVPNSGVSRVGFRGGGGHHPKFFGGQFLGGKIFIAENAFLDHLGWDIRFFQKNFKT